MQLLNNGMADFLKIGILSQIYQGVTFMCVIPVVWCTISMAIYVRGTYRQNTTI